MLRPNPALQPRLGPFGHPRRSPESPTSAAMQRRLQPGGAHVDDPGQARPAGLRMYRYVRMDGREAAKGHGLVADAAGAGERQAVGRWR